VAAPFQSSRAKLARAEEHRKAIEPEIKAFAAGNSVRLRSKHNLTSSYGPIRFSWFVEEMTNPPRHWALVAGDAIQNIRAALDHAIWSIVVKEKGSSFAEAHHMKIDFPIRDVPSRFPSRRMTDIGLPKAVINVIEDAQPYAREPTAPRDDATWLIGALSNVDKHRLLHVIRMISEDAEVRTTPLLENGHVEFVTDGRLRKGAQVVRFSASRPPGGQFVEVKFLLRAGISIEATPETRAVPIDLALRAMRDRASEIIDALAAAVQPPKRRSASRR
jgi:hypothetical protein